MKSFIALYDALDITTSTNAKVEALVQYFSNASSEDAAWALFFLTGRRIKRMISSKKLREWALIYLDMPEWLYQDAYIAVGDTSETISLLIGNQQYMAITEDLPLSQWMAERILPLQRLSDPEQEKAVTSWWRDLEQNQIFMLNKLLLGGFRVGVSQNLVVRALAQVAGHETAIMAHRLMGTWSPTGSFYETLIGAEHNHNDLSRPYPFYLASPLENELETLGPVTDWSIEWKWDGIRAQLIRRHTEIYLWSRGEELVTDRFPEVIEAALAYLPDGIVIDGEILAFENDRPLPFAVLQTRIGRKKLTANALANAPIVFMAYDLLEENHEDIRTLPLSERQSKLRALLQNGPAILQMSPQIDVADWQAAETLRAESRSRNVEGFMIKRYGSPYQAGRKRGDWWKWKIDPFSVDAVLIYAQAGSGRRANLYTDYTFAVWKDTELVPVAKAYSGLTDVEIGQLDRWIRQHTLDRFGPVRMVEPFYVFELGFEGIAASTRHKSGIALRFPRILRWRTDKTKEAADTLETLQKLLVMPHAPVA